MLYNGCVLVRVYPGDAGPHQRAAGREGDQGAAAVAGARGPPRTSLVPASNISSGLKCYKPRIRSVKYWAYVRHI